MNTYCAQFGDKTGSVIGVGGSGTNEALILSRATGKVIGAIRELEKSVYCLAFSPNQRYCAVGSGDGAVYLLQK